MNIDPEKVLNLANVHYKRIIIEQAKKERGLDLSYQAPETFPPIQSRQVKALAHAICDELNELLKNIPHMREFPRPSSNTKR